MTLRQELDRVEAEIARLQTIRDYLQERVHMNGERPAQPSAPQRRLTAARAAEIVLEREGQLKTPALLDAIRAEGAQLKDSDSLYKTLTRQPERFKRVGRGLWTLA